MAIALRAAGGGSYILSAASSLLLLRPSGTEGGDLLVASLSWESGQTLTVPSGWSVIANGVTPAFSPMNVSAAIYRVVESGDSSWNFSWSGNTTGAIDLLSFSGVDPANPIDSTATPTAGHSLGTTLAASNDTVETAGSWFLIAAGMAGSSFSSPAFTAGTFNESDAGTISPTAGWLLQGPLSQGRPALSPSHSTQRAQPPEH